MALRYILKDAQKQAEQSNQVCQQVLSYLKQVRASLQNFADLKEEVGPSVKTAQDFAITIYDPLAHGLENLCDEIISQNKRFIKLYQDEVANVSLAEDEIRTQVNEVKQMRLMAESLQLENQAGDEIDQEYKAAEQKLTHKMQKLEQYNDRTAGYFEEARYLFVQIQTGLRELASQTHFNTKRGEFSTDKMDLSWLGNLKQYDKEHVFAKRYGIPEPLDTDLGTYHRYLEEIIEQEAALREAGWSDDKVKKYFNDLGKRVVDSKSNEIISQVREAFQATGIES
ncbi:hypothetical protein [Eupransor demetentiae]|uniref:Toxin component of the YeeF-YezG toxin-antitoxin module (YeeF) n=1 Tax=Eupransor demetentiae TaxID=3109584 RepID=A0ABP0ERQ6_9LACO|nr:Predicted ribonuclease [Lactobacillaceae bacterium LMG 33000]